MQETSAILVQALALGGCGMSVVVKDCLDVAGYPTRCGSRLFASAPPAAEHSAVVEALLAGGCRIVGKANMHELAYGMTGINAVTGTPPNPRYPDRVPGGSSSGSAAAVAAQLVDFALGTDTGGSIRLPAVCCGIYGFKPSFGRISRRGAHPSESSLDCIGIFARDMTTIARAMAVIDPGFGIAPPCASVKLGVVTVEVDPEIARAVDKALAATGFELYPLALSSMEEAHEAALTIIAAEMFKSFGTHCGLGLLGADIDARLQAAGKITAQQVAAAEAVRTRFTAEVDAALAQVDALALPVLPGVPPTIAEAADARVMLPLTKLIRPFNLSGHPALAIPLETTNGRPAGLQLVGAKRADSELCAVGSAVEKVLR